MFSSLVVLGDVNHRLGRDDRKERGARERDRQSLDEPLAGDQMAEGTGSCVCTPEGGGSRGPMLVASGWVLLLDLVCRGKKEDTSSSTMFLKEEDFIWAGRQWEQGW